MDAKQLNFGTRLKELREKRSMTQQQLANLLNVGRPTIAGYETKGKEPDYSKLRTLSRYFDVSIDYLLGHSDNPLRDEDLEWRWPHTTNRLGNIIKEYLHQNQISSDDFAKSLGVTRELLMDFMAGISTPSYDVFKKISSETNLEIDYLLGAINSSKNNDSIRYSYHNDFSFHSRLESLSLSNNVNGTNCLDKLGIPAGEYSELSFMRMPTLSELLKIASAFNVSLDYLVGRVDTPNLNLTDDELSLLLNYRDCSPQFKKNILERAEKLSYESINTSTVAADELKQAK